MDSGRNNERPPWFFANTTREGAESILTLGKRYGNILMRESVTYKKTGSYVISMRREVAGGTQLNHYEVQKTGKGFKINVDNDHRPMQCLNDVMEFFVRQAGPGSSPLRTNNLSKLGLNVAAQPRSRGSDSGMEDDDVRSSHSSPAMPSHTPGMPRSAPRTTPGKMHMNVSGNVPNEMSAVAMDIEYSMQKTTPKWDDSRMAMLPAPPAPPPPPQSAAIPSPPPPMVNTPLPDYANTSRYTDPNGRTRGSGPPQDGGFSDPNLNRAVPPRHPPTETMQRAAGHHETYYNHSRDRRQSAPDYAADTFDSPATGGPPAPPPPPSAMMASPPPSLAPAPAAPPAPPPAPAADSGPPAVSSFQAMLQQNELSPVTRNPDAASPGLHTTPNRGRGGGGAGPMSFEDELKKRLITQREDVYASGATILKSANWQ